MNRDDGIGIELISALGLPPVEYIRLAAELGCSRIGIALQPIVALEQYPRWSLRDDAVLRRDTKKALLEYGVSVSVGEGFLGLPGVDISNAAADLDIIADLGAPIVNLVSVDSLPSRAIDQCATFVEMAAERQLTATLEFLPGLPLARDMPSALDLVRRVGHPGLKLLLDAMHVFRSGSTVADVAALDPDLIGYVQLCDVPLVSRHENYADEARYDRLAPGEGELPLREFLAAIPANVSIGLEIPMLARAKAGIGPRERLSGCLLAARELLATAR